MSWKDTTEIVEVLDGGEICPIQVKKDLEELKCRKGPLPKFPGVYQWRPVAREWWCDAEAAFWVPKFGWAKGILDEEPDLMSLPISVYGT